jgi:4-amino-4-deoxy-L-arabinose transferase-like glycosyltransferase
MLQESVAEKTTKRNWLANLYTRLETYEDSDPTPFGPLILAFCLYAFIVLAMGSRQLWFDELCTYYIAKAPTIKQLFVEIPRLDLQPPLQYLLTRISLSLLGDTNLATRLPSIIAFTVASVCLYHFVRRRLGRFYGLTAMLVFWLAPFLQYATEARPYALVVGFLCVSMLGWQTAIEGERRHLGLLAIAFGVWGMIVTHAFSPLLVAILGIAELVRSIDRHKIDWPIWIALLAPSPFVIVYLPILRNFHGWTALPPEFQASPFKIISFYAELLSSVSVVLLFALIVALIVCRSAEQKAKENIVVSKHEVALVLGLLSMPILVNLLLMRTGGAFWSRYCISSAIGFSLLFVYILAKLTNASRAAAAVSSGIVFSGIALGILLQVVHPQARAMVKNISLKELDPRIPLVDASGLTFVEMNKRQDASLMSRVFYLTDRDAAIRYAHATIFENIGILHDYWPIGGTVMPYHDFVRQNSHFFVLGTPDYPEDWLIPKLMDDGAELDFKGELRSSYKDNMVFEVTLSAAKPPSQK